MATSQINLGGQALRVGDFIFGCRRRIGVVVNGTIEELPSTNVDDGMHVVELPGQNVAMRIATGDVHIPWEEIERIAHAVAERIQATIGLSRNDYTAATALLNKSEPGFYTNQLFHNPSNPVLQRIFKEIIEELYPDSPDRLEEVERVAHLAIFSRFLIEE